MRQQAKSFIVKALCNARMGDLVKATTRGQVRSRRARFDVSGWEPHLAAAVAFRLYERAEARFAIKYLAGASRVLELGGSRGVVSSVLLRHLPPSAELVSVEANPTLVADLQENLARNRGPRRAEGRHLAVSDGSKLLFDTSRGALGSALSETTGERVPTTTLQELIGGLGWPDYVLLSDIEGAEASFVLGPTEPLQGCSRMVMELHRTTVDGGEITPSDLLAELTGRHGFQLLDRHKDVVVLDRTS